MPRMIATTWFEDISWWNQPMLDFRFVRLSVRQAIYAGIFGGLSYIVSMIIMPIFTSDIIYLSIAGLGVFVTGMGLFARQGGVYSPEWYLFHFLQRHLSFFKKTKRGKGKTTRKEQLPEQRRSRPMTVPLGEPTRVAGVLYDPSSGERIQNENYDVFVDGKPYHSGRTDKDGAFSLIFTPPGPGKYHLDIKPKGYGEEAQRVLIESRPTVGTKEDRRVMGRDILQSRPVEGPEEPEEPEEEEGDLYTYELFPASFIDLSPKNQDKIVNRFRSFLNSLDREVKIIVEKSKKKIELGEKTTETESNDYYIQSREPVDAQLDAGGFQYQRTTESLDPRVTSSHTGFFHGSVIVKGGQTKRSATIVGMPNRLVEGFPAEVYGVADRFTIKIRPLEQGEAVRKVERFMTFQEAITYRGRGGREEETKTMRAQEMLRRLTEENSRLFEATINITVGGTTEESLNNSMDRLESICRGRLIEVDDPNLIQEELLTGNCGKELIMDTFTLGCFYPFVSSDVIETPGGVFLGVNRRTGSPVIYDPLVRSSPHLSIIARTGGGKSFLAKAYLTRLFDKHPDLSFFIVDPEDEYALPTLALDRETQVIDVTRGSNLGLDPLKLFPNSKDIVLDMLIDALDLGEGESELLSELRVEVERSSSLEELRENVGKKLGKRLDGLIKGPEKFLFSGEPSELSDRVVFNLRDLHQALKLSDRRIGTLHTASLLLFGKIWQKIEELPLEKIKVVLVDEVWLYTQLPAAASFLEYVSRRGRRRNVVFLLSSQRPADVLQSEGGRAAVENCATKVFLQQDEAAIELLRRTFNLTESELDQCTKFSPGQAILTADDIKVPLKIVVSPDEYALFSTKPGKGV